METDWGLLEGTEKYDHIEILHQFQQIRINEKLYVYCNGQKLTAS